MGNPITSCNSNRHCVTHDFCHRCRPDLTVATRYLTKAVSAAGIRDGQAGVAYQLLASVVLDMAPEPHHETGSAA